MEDDEEYPISEATTASLPEHENKEEAEEAPVSVYDPVTEYNRDIMTDPEIHTDHGYGEKEADNTDTGTEDPDDYEDEYYEEESVQPDNTAIVKQYFETTRFIKPADKPGKYEIPVEDVLDIYQEESYDRIDERVREEAEILKNTLAEFKIEAEVTGIRKGPVITMF